MQTTTRRLSGGHIVTIVVAICAAVVLAPVGVMAATGSFVNITDPVTAANKARVNSAGALQATQVDPTTRSAARVDGGKLRVGDGSGGLTVDGTVYTQSADANVLLYKSPDGGVDCDASSTGLLLGTYDLSQFRKIRVAIHSGASQTIVKFIAKAGTEYMAEPWATANAGTNEWAHVVLDDPPTANEIRVAFCTFAQVFIWGLR